MTTPDGFIRSGQVYGDRNHRYWLVGATIAGVEDSWVELSECDETGTCPADPFTTQAALSRLYSSISTSDWTLIRDTS